MINMPSPVTEQGDITLHAKSGIRLPINFEYQGAPRDMTGCVVKFYIKGLALPFGLTAGDTPDEMVLLIPEGSCAALIGKKAEFALVDESTTPHTVEWSGMIVVTGFA